MNELEKTLKKIKDLKIQGANAVALASLNYLRKIRNSAKNHYLNRFNKAVELLIQSRPTEPLNRNFLKFINRQVQLNKNQPPRRLQKIVQQAVNYLLALNEKNQKLIVLNSQKIFRNKQKIFTHCHSSLVEKILIKAKNKKIEVFNTETRPLFQGRIMANNLVKAGLPVTMVADSAASFLISSSSGKEIMMAAAILGADAILPDGSIINKIGSYGIGLSCFQARTPLYIACSLLKYDVNGLIAIEIRRNAEIWPNKPKGLKIINFAFDKIPAKFITGIITEFGILKPFRIKKTVKKHYSWLYQI